MKHKNAIQDIALLQQALMQLEVETSTQATATHNHAVLLFFFCNANGSMRWVWPAGLKTPHFLRFYHSSHWRAKLFVGAVRLLFALGAGRLLAHGKCLLFTNQNGQQVIGKIWKDQWSVFTGTEGPNRKMLHWHKNSCGAGIFSKIALTHTAQQNLHNEQQSLQQVQHIPLQWVKTPQITQYRPTCLQLQQITGSHTHHIAQLPAPALQEWLQHSLQTLPLTQTACWHTALQNHRLALPQCSRHPLLHTLQNKLLQLQLHLQQTVSHIQTSGAHADFTPWNLRIINGQTIGLIDFELYRPQMPVLYDLFHFIYQSVILIEHGSYAHIQQQINRLLQQPQWQQFMKQHQLSATTLEQCYLLCNVSYYLMVYAQQQTWHTQVTWLLNVWNEALNYHLLQYSPATNARRLLLADLPHLLQQHPHAVLKLRVNNLEELPENADLDICLPQHAAKALLRDLKQHPAVTRIETRNFTFMQQAAVHLLNGTTLHLDLIWQFKRKQLQFLTAAHVWKQAQPTAAGVNCPQPVHEFAYIWLFYHLNGAAVPAHYCQLLHNQIEQSNSQNLCNQLVYSLLQTNNNYRKILADLPLHTNTITANLLQQAPNKGLKGWVNRFAYGFDTLRQFFGMRGMVITFSGVDGAGKSTVIQHLKTRLEKEHRKRVVVLRHRPSLLPILSAFKHGRQKAEQLAAANLPRQGNNQSALSSGLRFAYYYTDYLLGQFYVFFRYTLRGYLVLYDRYYFDFIADGKRSNLKLPQRFTSFLYRFLLKPKHNFFLYAPPAHILQRKQELNEQTILQLTAAYIGLFENLNVQYRQSHYTALQNITLSETLTKIINQINNFSHEKSGPKNCTVAQPAVYVSPAHKQCPPAAVCS